MELVFENLPFDSKIHGYLVLRFVKTFQIFISRMGSFLLLYHAVMSYLYARRFFLR